MADASNQSAQDLASNFTSRQRTIALVVVAIAFVMDLLDSTIVNIAIPSIQANLSASYASIQWLIAGYALAFAALLITGGRMGDVFGYRKLFMLGVGGFTLASLLSGLAWTPEVLVLSRLLQGSMAALMVPQVMSLMQVMYEPHERTSVMGLFGALGGLAASLGPILGGILIQANLFHLDWRPIFLINVPVGIAGLIAAYFYLPEGKSAHPLKLDLWGTGVIIIALLLLIYPLIQGRELGWPFWSFAMLVGSLPILIIFAWWQRRKERLDGSPLVMPILFKQRSFWMGLLVNLIFESALLGFFLTFTLMLQIGLQYAVLKAALTGISTAAGITFSIAGLGQKLLPKLGRYCVSLGAVITILGLTIVAWTIDHFGLSATPYDFIPGLFIVGSGMGLIMAPIFAVALNDVDPGHAGSASGTLNAVQQVGGAVGIALIGVIFFGQLTAHASNSFTTVEPMIRSQLAAAELPKLQEDVIVSGIRTCFVDRTTQKDPTETPDSCQKLTASQSTIQNPQQAAFYTQLMKTITSAATKANEDNFSHAFDWGIGYEIALTTLVLVLSFFLPRHIRAEVAA